MPSKVTLLGAAWILFLGTSTILSSASSVAAQNVTPSSDPRLKPYSDWVRESVDGEYTRHWKVFDGGPGREPFVVFCRDSVFGAGALRGANIRVRPGSAAQEFFPKVTGKTAQLLAAAEINVAMKLNIIDCLGFGGEPYGATATVETGNITRQTIDSVARSLDFDVSNEPLVYRSMDVLEWKIYRSLNGDLGQLLQLFGSYLFHANSTDTNSAPAHHMAGFWAVRIFEYTSRGQTVPNDELKKLSRGDCEGREELCKGVQIELKRIGRYAGAIDGIIGRGTIGAIEAIAGTRPTGDLTTLTSLDEFVAARRPVAADVEEPSNEEAKDAEPAAVPDAPPPTLPQNLDDF